MIRTSIYLFIILTSFSILYADKVEEKFENGKIKVSYLTDKDGLKTSTYKEYYENGKQKISATYLKGQLNGMYQKYNENGQKIETAQYKAGLRHGPTNYYENNRLQKEEIWYEGVIAFPKSIREIQKTLSEIDKMKVDIVGEWPAGFKQDLYTNASIDDATKGVTILRKYRYLSDLHYKQIQLDKYYMGCDFMATEILNKLNKLDHHPKNPGMPEADFKLGYAGTSQSNLAMSGRGSTAEGSVKMYMFDSDPSNISRVGHRRWCLNPAMGKTGFGSQGKFSAMWSFDDTYKADKDWDAVMYPPRGYFPNDLWQSNSAFSIGLNPMFFDVKATITKAQIKIEEMRNFTAAGKPIEIEYLNQNYDGMGVTNCLIFKPKTLSSSAKKRYKITIEGLKHKTIKDYKMEYFVEFF